MLTGIASLFGIVALWSVIPSLIKLLLPTFDPFVLGFLRLILATFVYLGLFLYNRNTFSDIRFSWWYVFGGVALGINYLFYAFSLSHTTASAGCLIVQVQYVTLAALATIVLKEQLTPLKWLGMTIVLLGVFFVIISRDGATELVAPQYFIGNILMVFAGFGWGVYALANKALAPQLSSAMILFPIFLISSVVAYIPAHCSIIEMSMPSTDSIVIVFFLGAVCSGGSFLFLSEAMKRLSAVLVGSATALAPIAQISVANYLLGEPITIAVVIGGVVIISGVSCMVYSERSETPQ
ncbi:MAG: DMT family transporter [Candidatus Latescibacterota bacterium]|nr:DMT family transporter [Candidatus Latescibacterota bacterium]